MIQERSGFIRPLHAGDCEAAARVIRRAFAAIPVAVQPPPSALRVTATDVAAHLAAGGGGLMMAPERGCVLLAAHAGALHVSRLAIAPEHRRQGLALALLTAAEEAARHLGLARLTLSARLALDGNRRLFARAGYVEGARHAHPGFDRPTFVDMEKAVAAGGERVQRSA